MSAAGREFRVTPNRGPLPGVDHGAQSHGHRRVAETVGASGAERHDQRSPGAAGTADEDAATVIAILTALAAASGPDEPEPATRSVWADPAHRLGLRSVSGSGWWASGLAR